MEEYFYRLICLVVDIGTDVMLNFFKSRIPANQSLDAFLSSRMNTINRLRKQKVLNDLQYKALTATPIDESSFDISLLYILISNLTGVQPPSGGWHIKAPLPSDTSPGALLIKLRLIRNETIAHRAKGKLTQAEFEKYWKETEDVLVGLAGEISNTEEEAVKVKIKDAKVKRLVDTECKLHSLTLSKLQDDLADLSKSLDQFKQKVTFS